MRVLVTGAAGFIGSHVIEQLVTGTAAGTPGRSGAARLVEGNGPGEILAVDDFSAGRVDRVAGVMVERLDITRAGEVAAAFRDFRPEAVIHLAAQVSVERSLERPDLDVDVNVYGTLNLLREAVAAGTRRLVFASSAAVYGDPQRLPVDEDHPLAPLSVYGRSKLTAEWLIRQYAQGTGLEAVILRLGNVYGPGQRPETGPVVARFFLDAIGGEGPVIHGDGQQTRDFVYVGDVARAFALALTGPAGVVVNIAGGTATTIGDLAQRIGRLVEGAPAPRYGPPRPGDIRHSVLANHRARRLLGWAPAVGLDEGLAATYRWYRQQVAQQVEQVEQVGQVGKAAG